MNTSDCPFQRLARRQVLCKGQCVGHTTCPALFGSPSSFVCSHPLPIFLLECFPFPYGFIRYLSVLYCHKYIFSFCSCIHVLCYKEVLNCSLSRFTDLFFYYHCHSCHAEKGLSQLKIINLFSLYFLYCFYRFCLTSKYLAHFKFPCKIKLISQVIIPPQLTD